MMVRIAMGLPANAPVEIKENPLTKPKQTWKLNANSEWTIDPRNVTDTVPEITIAVETEGARITNPTISNLDTGESIMFGDSLSYGDVLKIKDGAATLNGKDVSEKLSVKKVPSLPRRKTRWQYTEAVGANIGTFDRSMFDKSVFAVNLLTAVTFEWTARQPASFEVRIPKEQLKKSGVSREYIQELVNSVKACGVKGEVTVV